jgi:hypothetical protein
MEERVNKKNLLRELERRFIALSFSEEAQLKESALRRREARYYRNVKSGIADQIKSLRLSLAKQATKK